MGLKKGEIKMAGVNLNPGIRAPRKTLITVAEWQGEEHDIYKKVTGSSAPTWEADKYYSRNADGTYVLTTVEPADWSTNYTMYYTKESSTRYREILGTRTEDSSIEFNPDIETMTDIRGITYTDVNKTEPQQNLDPFYVLGGSELSAYLAKNALENNISKYSNCFNVYVITAFLGEEGEYGAVMHEQCSILPTSMGGDSYVSMPIEIHFSNVITKGNVDKLSEDFIFSPVA